VCNNSGFFFFFFQKRKRKTPIGKIDRPLSLVCEVKFSFLSSSSSDPPTWTQAHHPTQWQSWRIHNTQSIENIVLIIWCHIKGFVYLISFIYFFLKLIYSRCISLTNWSWFAIPTFQFRQVESCRKSQNFRQVSKKKSCRNFHFFSGVTRTCCCCWRYPGIKCITSRLRSSCIKQCQFPLDIYALWN
jgi:hypothetical protein